MQTPNHTSFLLALESTPFDADAVTKLLHTGAAVLDPVQWKAIFDRYNSQPILQNYIFLAACSLGLIDIVNIMLQEKPSLINSVDAEGSNAFLIAAINGQTEFVQWLLNKDHIKYAKSDSRTLVSSLLDSINNYLFSFKNENGSDVIPSDETLQSSFDQWDIYVNTCKKIDLSATLLIDADVANRYGQYEKAYNDFSDILDATDSPSDIKQQASLSIAELLMMGRISFKNSVLSKGLAVEEIPQIKADDLPAIATEKKRKSDDILIARAIQAYEFIFNYRDTEIGKRLFAQFNHMMAGQNTPYRESSKWLIRAGLLYSEYYSQSEQANQTKRVLEKAQNSENTTNRQDETTPQPLDTSAMKKSIQ